MVPSSTVLVTGGAGYIGSHTCLALKNAGFTPVAYDNLSRGHRQAVKWGPLVEADLFDQAALDQAFAQYQPVAVIHFAAFAYVGESMTEPGKYYWNNVAGSIALLEAMRRAGVGRIVFSSTCAAYGIPDTVPVSETSLLQPVNPYGSSKVMIETALRDYAAIHNFSFVTLRYFNAAGADPEGQLGEQHDPEPHLIPRAILAALGEIPALDVFGDDYDTPDGTCIRDYVHVSDLAAGHIAALTHLLAGGAPLVANLGTGRPSSVKQIIAAVERVSGRTVPVRYAPRRPGDPPVLYADPARARDLLGFRPRYASIEPIIATAWNYFAARSGR